ncbi:MAG: radical SAM/SPASM domain-containing protein [Promethearchaeota archaeon]
MKSNSLLENLKFKNPKFTERFKIAIRKGHFPIEPRKVKSLFQWLQDRSKPILYLMLGVTYRCQLLCNHCAVNSYIKKDQKDLTTEEIKDLIDQSANLFALNLIGGEPTLRKDLMEIIEYASNKAMLISIDSNGISMTEDYVQQLKEAGIDIVFISLDSATPEIHDANRNLKGCFDISMRAMKNAVGAGIKRCYFSYTMTNEGLENGDFERLIEVAKSAGAHGVRYLPPYPTGRWLHHSEVILTASARKKLWDLANKHFPYVFREWHTQYQDNPSCVALKTKIYYYVSPYGEVQPCITIPYSFGNIRERPLKEIFDYMWNHPLYEKMCKCSSCAMADTSFRKDHIENISINTQLPIKI